MNEFACNVSAEQGGGESVSGEVAAALGRPCDECGKEFVVERKGEK